MTTVQNKTALVTGASRGIGRATAVALARCEIGALPSPNPEVVTVVPDCSGCACVEYVRDELVVTLLALDRRRVLHFNVTEHPTVALDGPADRGRLPGRLRPVLPPPRSR